jgi:serine/threonine protein kinase
MLKYDPAKRPTAAECLQYPFFKVRVPIPVSAPVITNQEDVDRILDEADLSLSRRPSEFQREFDKKQRQAILREETGNQDTESGVQKSKISSLGLLRKARYKPGVPF